MFRQTLCAAGCCMLLGCASTPRAAQATLEDRPSLIVEGRPWNAGILNPTPHFGIDQPDGDVWLNEFRVEINELAIESSTHRLTIRGRVLTADSLRRTMAYLVTWGSGGEVVSRVVAGLETEFALSVDPEETPVLSVERLGMRSLRLDLRRLSRRAERRGPTPASP
jgi:hypothetical protein